VPKSEQRSIMFDADGVLRAIVAASACMKPLGLPRDRATTSISFDEAEQCIVLEYGPSRPHPAVRLKSETLCAILLNSCIRQGLPIPRHADKSVEVQTAAALLKLRIEIDRQRCEEQEERLTRRLVRLGQSWIDGEKAV